MEQIAENTADSLTESVKEVNQFTQYFQGKMPGLMDLGIKLVIVLIAFFCLPQDHSADPEDLWPVL